jgi:hypothetical protein
MYTVIILLIVAYNAHRLTLHSSWSSYCPHMLLYAVTLTAVVENGGSVAVGGLTTKQAPRPSHRRDEA